MKKAESVEVVVLGRKYYFKGSDPDEIKRRADTLNSELQELNAQFNTVDQSKLFIYYAMLLAERIEDQSEQNRNLAKELERLNSLLSGISLDFEE